MGAQLGNENVFRRIARCRHALESGRVVAVPTETVYGLAGLIDEPEALKQIFVLKERPYFDPLIVHVGYREQLSEVSAGLSELDLSLTNAFWPGPLTLVVPKLPSLNPIISAGLETVGVRMPAHPIALRLLRTLRAPFAAPSANKFGRTSPTLAEHVRVEFRGIDLPILDGGAAALGLESTVVQTLKVNGKWRIEILRPGMITHEALSRVCRKIGVDAEIYAATSAASPGSLPEHYQPAIPLVIFGEDARRDIQASREFVAERLKVSADSGVELSLEGAPIEVARRLYAEMRERATSGARYIFVQRRDSQKGEHWEAIWNRLERAAKLTVC